MMCVCDVGVCLSVSHEKANVHLRSHVLLLFAYLGTICLYIARNVVRKKNRLIMAVKVGNRRIAQNTANHMDSSTSQANDANMAGATNTQISALNGNDRRIATNINQTK